MGMISEQIKLFRKSIFDNEVTKIAIDVAEVGLDSLTSDGLLKELPGLNIVMGLIKTKQNIQEKFALRKLLTFLNNLNDISDKEKKQFYEKLNTDEEEQQKFFERLFLILDRLDDVEKAKISSNIFKLYILGVMSRSLFLRLINIVEKAYLDDILYLYYDSHTAFKIWGHDIAFKMSRNHYHQSIESNLISLGLKREVLDYEDKNRLTEKPTIKKKINDTELTGQLTSAMYYSVDLLNKYKLADIDSYHYSQFK